jgi:ADP-ribosylglycohydrolase
LDSKRSKSAECPRGADAPPSGDRQGVSKRDQDHFRGCIVGGAVGDALGWPVEFSRLDDILRRHGPSGISDLQVSSSGTAPITDDTQMTLFTAEGILRAYSRYVNRGICHIPSVVHCAYLRWLLTQGYPKVERMEWMYESWLLDLPELHSRRAPGNTCLSALASGRRGTVTDPINDSKGCGAVMRVAPAGLFFPPKTAFAMAVDFAAITHGHPSGYLSAGALAYMIAAIIEGQDLRQAATGAIAALRKYDGHEECLRSLVEALDLSETDKPVREAIKQIGEGWIGEEALAIAVYCALKHQDDFRSAVIAGVNHDGDSDSTGAITGNILGAYLGLSRIPPEWAEVVELRDVLIQIADDLLIRYRDGAEWWKKYPGC